MPAANVSYKKSGSGPSRRERGFILSLMTLTARNGVGQPPSLLRIHWTAIGSPNPIAVFFCFAMEARVMTEKKNGRPPLYDTPEELEAACNAYFMGCDVREEPYTVTGLALDLGFSSRQSLDDTSKRDGFSDVVKRAKLLVEKGYEMRLHGNNPTGAIFSLKNMGWKDEQRREISGGLSLSGLFKQAKAREDAIDGDA